MHTVSQVNHKSQPFWVKKVHLVPNVHTLTGHAGGTIRLAPKTIYPPFRHITQNQVFIPALDLLFFAKIRLEIVTKYMMSEQE